MIDMVKHNLGAEVRLNYPESGIEWRMKCPAEKVLASVPADEAEERVGAPTTGG
jgi:hypothetical protein